MLLVKLKSRKKKNVYKIIYRVMSTSKQIPTDQTLYDRIKDHVKARVDRWPSAYASGQVVQ